MNPDVVALNTFQGLLLQVLLSDVEPETRTKAEGLLVKALDRSVSILSL